jgi:hypothetical protein
MLRKSGRFLSKASFTCECVVQRNHRQQLNVCDAPSRYSVRSLVWKCEARSPTRNMWGSFSGGSFKSQQQGNPTTGSNLMKSFERQPYASRAYGSNTAHCLSERSKRLLLVMTLLSLQNLQNAVHGQPRVNLNWLNAVFTGNFHEPRCGHPMH